MDILGEFHWFFELGYTIIISTVLAMLLTNVWKLTFLKKFLTTANANEKDKVLGAVGSVTSLVVYALVYIVNIMIVEKTWVFFLSVDWNSEWVCIVSGASVTWVAAKGLYTSIHKFISRIKSGKDAQVSLAGFVTDVKGVRSQVELETERTPEFSKSKYFGRRGK